MQPEEADESLGLPARSLVITPQELALILGWDRSLEENKHPLYCIDTLLQVMFEICVQLNNITDFKTA